MLPTALTAACMTWAAANASAASSAGSPAPNIWLNCLTNAALPGVCAFASQRHRVERALGVLDADALGVLPGERRRARLEEVLRAEADLVERADEVHAVGERRAVHEDVGFADFTALAIESKFVFSLAYFVVYTVLMPAFSNFSRMPWRTGSANGSSSDG